MDTFDPVKSSPLFSEAALHSLLAIDVDTHFEVFIKVYHVKVCDIIRQIFNVALLEEMDKIDILVTNVFLQMYSYLKNLKSEEILKQHLWAKICQFTMDCCFVQLLDKHQIQIYNAIQSILSKDKLEQEAAIITLAEEIFASIRQQLSPANLQTIEETQFWLWLHNSIIAYCFEQLLEIYRPQLEAFVIRLCNNTTDAEDIIQQTFLSAFQYVKTHGIPSKGTFDPKGWIFTIAKNAFHKSLRKNNPLGRDLSIDTLSEEHPIFEIEDDHNIPPHMVLELAETQRDLAALINQLPKPYREAIRLRFFEGLSNDEIAIQLSIRPVTIRSWIHRGVKLLRQLMNIEVSKQD